MWTREPLASTPIIFTRGPYVKAGSGKGKGSAYERSVCKQLSLWITHGALADCLWRSALSGGRATVAHRKGQSVRQAGDITAVSPEGHVLCDVCFIECKHYRSLDLEAFFLSGKGKLASFWRIAQREAQKYGKTPIILARQNRTPDLVIAPLEFWQGFLCELPSGMSIEIRRKGLACDVRFLTDLLRTPFELRARDPLRSLDSMEGVPARANTGFDAGRASAQRD